MDDAKWFYAFLIGLVLVMSLFGYIMSQADETDKKMCTEAGMSWTYNDDGKVICDGSNNN